MQKTRKAGNTKEIVHSFSRGYADTKERRKSVRSQAHKIAEEAVRKFPLHEALDDVRGIDQ